MPPLFQSVYSRFLTPTPTSACSAVVVHYVESTIVYIVCGCQWCNPIWICHPFITLFRWYRRTPPLQSKVKKPNSSSLNTSTAWERPSWPWCNLSLWIPWRRFPINCGTACPFVLLPAHSGVCINWFDEFSYRSFLALLLCNLCSKPRCNAPATKLQKL